MGVGQWWLRRLLEHRALLHPMSLQELPARGACKKERSEGWRSERGAHKKLRLECAINARWLTCTRQIGSRGGSRTERGETHMHKYVHQMRGMEGSPLSRRSPFCGSLKAHARSLGRSAAPETVQMSPHGRGSGSRARLRDMVGGVSPPPPSDPLFVLADNSI